MKIAAPFRRAWSSRGLPGEPVLDMLVEGVESRFDDAKVGAGVELEFLGNNGGASGTTGARPFIRPNCIVCEVWWLVTPKQVSLRSVPE